MKREATENRKTEKRAWSWKRSTQAVAEARDGSGADGGGAGRTREGGGEPRAGRAGEGGSAPARRELFDIIYILLFYFFCILINWYNTLDLRWNRIRAVRGADWTR